MTDFDFLAEERAGRAAAGHAEKEYPIQEPSITGSPSAMPEILELPAIQGWGGILSLTVKIPSPEELQEPCGWRVAGMARLEPPVVARYSSGGKRGAG
jgi:hypothetical protein